MVIAALDHRGAAAILEFEESAEGAGDTPRRIEHLRRGAQAAYQAAADGADDVELVRPLPPQDAVAEAGRDFLRRARPVEPIGEAPVVDHHQPAQFAAQHQFADAANARLETVLDV